MRPLALAVLACVLAPRPAAAVFTAAQMDRIDHEPLLDSEYFADLATFAEPLAWQEARRSTAPFYRINTFSLDCCDLYIDQELRFQKSLTDSLTFRFRFTQLEDKERRETHHWLELEQKVAAGFSAIVFGEPTFRKEDADIGFGAAWTGSAGTDARLRLAARRVFVDFNFNQRGSTGARYSRKPQTDELTAAFETDGHLVEARLELDRPLGRQVPDQARAFSYRRETAGLAWRGGAKGGPRPVVEYGYEAQRKGDALAPDPAALSSENARRTHRLLAALEAGRGRDRLEVGHRLLLRSARTDFANAPGAGVLYRRWESQPYARWRRDLSARLTSELAAFLAFGEDRRRYPGASSASRYEQVSEARLGAGLDFNFGPSGRIGLYGAFDLDTPGHLWDGGNVRAMLLF